MSKLELSDFDSSTHSKYIALIASGHNKRADMIQYLERWGWGHKSNTLTTYIRGTRKKKQPDSFSIANYIHLTSPKGKKVHTYGVDWSRLIQDLLKEQLRIYQKKVENMKTIVDSSDELAYQKLKKTGKKISTKINPDLKKKIRSHNKELQNLLHNCIYDYNKFSMKFKSDFQKDFIATFSNLIKLDTFSKATAKQLKLNISLNMIFHWFLRSQATYYKHNIEAKNMSKVIRKMDKDMHLMREGITADNNLLSDGLFDVTGVTDVTADTDTGNHPKEWNEIIKIVEVQKQIDQPKHPIFLSAFKDDFFKKQEKMEIEFKALEHDYEEDVICKLKEMSPNELLEVIPKLHLLELLAQKRY